MATKSRYTAYAKGVAGIKDGKKNKRSVLEALKNKKAIQTKTEATA